LYVNVKALLLFSSFFLLTWGRESQQISKQELIFLTPEWKSERFVSG